MLFITESPFRQSVVLSEGLFGFKAHFIADQTLALNWSATDIAGNKDVDVVAGTPCIITAGVNNVTQKLNARPAITNPNPTPFLSAN